MVEVQKEHHPTAKLLHCGNMSIRFDRLGFIRWPPEKAVGWKFDLVPITLLGDMYTVGLLELEYI